MVLTKNIQQPSLLQELMTLEKEVIIEGLNHRHFQKLAAQFPELRMEQEKDGKIKIMPPVSGYGGKRESRLSTRLDNWSLTIEKGEVFGSNTGFILPDGSTKSPDAAWLSEETSKKLETIYKGEGFLPIVPDFIVEIRSKTDSLTTLKNKIEKTWLANGVQLAWLIDPYQEKAHIFHIDDKRSVVKGFDNVLKNEDLLPGFKLNLQEFRLRESEKK